MVKRFPMVIGVNLEPFGCLLSLTSVTVSPVFFMASSTDLLAAGFFMVRP